ncbi:MAG: glycosyltransferase family 2 protein [Rickettsiales bacterium]|nr:glycosyltransferase family 2 protein [Rickettsiales bacterium]
MPKISAVIVAHNEEKKIADCLKSLSFADEIVVVLDKCTDGTKEIVQKFTDKIIEGSWRIEGARRNVALGAATHDWILEADCDERFSAELAAEILEITKNSVPCAARVTIANFVGTREVKFGWLRTVAPLDREILTFRGAKKYHEDREIHPTYDLKAEVKILKNPLTHLMDDDIADTLNRFNRYTNWRANDMRAKGKIKGGFFKSVLDFKLRFFKAFVVKKGYKEGALGFLIAVLAGLYPLVSYLKARESK